MTRKLEQLLNLPQDEKNNLDEQEDVAGETESADDSDSSSDITNG
jgi:hypothetical protein